jgi:hypothetical protein
LADGAQREKEAYIHVKVSWEKQQDSVGVTIGQLDKDLCDRERVEDLAADSLIIVGRLLA